MNECLLASGGRVIHFDGLGFADSGHGILDLNAASRQLGVNFSKSKPQFSAKLFYSSIELFDLKALLGLASLNRLEIGHDHVLEKPEYLSEHI